jgi:hypothetical protein
MTLRRFELVTIKEQIQDLIIDDISDHRFTYFDWVKHK